MLRPTIYALLTATLASPLVTQSPDARAQDDMGRFPRVEGTNLEGERFTLPADFAGEINVVLVAFQRDQQQDVDTWMPLLKRIADTNAGLRVYELPTLARRYRLMRSFIDGGMRAGIPDRAVRAATVTLYIDKSPFRRALGLPDEDRIYVLLVDREGRVHWRTDGAFDAKAGAELESTVSRLVSPAAEDCCPR
jgi:hypothetical protein